PRIADDCDERQYDDGEVRCVVLVRSWIVPRLRRPALRRNSIDMDRFRDVLELLLAQIDELSNHPALALFIDRSRYTNPPRLGHRLETRRDVYADAQDLLAINQHITDVDTNPEQDTLIVGDAIVPWGHQSLDGNRAFHGAYHRQEFQEHAVAHDV